MKSCFPIRNVRDFDVDVLVILNVTVLTAFTTTRGRVDITKLREKSQSSFHKIPLNTESKQHHVKALLNRSHMNDHTYKGFQVYSPGFYIGFLAFTTFDLVII